MNRRDFIRLSCGTLAASYLSPSALGNANELAGRLRSSRGRIVSVVPGDGAEKRIELARFWDSDSCRVNLVNRGHRAVRIKEVVVCETSHHLPEETRLYGESFQMLSQTAGTLGHPLDLGYSEVAHYRIPQPPDALAASGLLTLSAPGRPPLLLGFSSCRRFIGRVFCHKGSIPAVVDTEGLELGPGESWEGEELMVAESDSRPGLLARLAERVVKNHPKRMFQPVPTGWCSWYCFGPKVTAEQVLENLDVISQKLPQLKYVQI